MPIDLITGAIGFLLTVMVFSYLIGDNFLYRLATHILIGVGAAYITVTVITDVLWPRLVQPILAQSSTQPIDVIVAGIGLILSVMLLFKALPDAQQIVKQVAECFVIMVQCRIRAQGGEQALEFIQYSG